MSAPADRGWPTGVLNRDETLKILTEHNAWRRGAKGPQTDPRMLGLALDAAIEALASAPQPPSGGEVSEVTRLLVERDAAGRKKYGTTLDRTDLSHADWLQHMAEELLDAAGYALAAKRTAPPSANYSIDADPDGIRAHVADAITGALAFGAQGTHKPPAGHWLEPFWDMARAERTTPPSAPVGVEAAKHWHDLYRKECQLRQDDAARYGQQIVDLEALAQQPSVAPVGVEGMVKAFEEYHRADHRDPAVAPEWEWWEAAWRAALAQQPAAVDGAIDKARFKRAPCYLCGYNGPGYYQPDTHPCAAKYHAAQPGGERA